MGVSKEERVLAERYARRFKMTDARIYYQKSKKYVFVTDEDDIEYRISMRKARAMKRKPTTREAVDAKAVFVRNARLVHGNRYGYDKVPSSRLPMQTKVTVTCFKHGDWDITALNHVQHRAGCPECNSRKIREGNVAFS